MSPMRQGAFGYTVSKSDYAELSAQQSDEAIRFPKSFSNSDAKQYETSAYKNRPEAKYLTGFESV